jgi:hypothetical protein
MDNLEIFKNEFYRIKNLGFVKSNRIHNTGIGKTFEDLLGILENNSRNPDFLDFEIKSQRFLTGSKVTLFTKSPTFPLKVNSLIRDKYGNSYKHNVNLKRIHTSVYGDKFNNYLNKYSFKLNVNKRSKKVYILIKDKITDLVLENNIYYAFSDIQESLRKLNNLAIVFANCKIENGTEYFHYTGARVFINLNFNKFINMIISGQIQYDIRIGSYKSGENIGKPHDHGSGFRIGKNNLINLYEKNYLFE